MTTALPAPTPRQRLWYGVLAGSWLAGIGLAVGLETVLPLALPAALLGFVLWVLDYRLLFWLFILLLPYSLELEVVGETLMLDLPNEPLMMVLALTAALVAVQGRLVGRTFWYHPLVLALLVQLLWLVVASLNSNYPLATAKYLLQKGWYLGALVLLPFALLQTMTDVQRLFRYSAIGMTGMMLLVLLRHGLHGFAWDEINPAGEPFYPNHVVYGCATALLVPVLWALRAWTRLRGGSGNLYAVLMGIAVVATVLSYTRASWLSLLLLPGVLLLVRWRLWPWVLPVALVGVAVGVFFLLENNYYLNLAPEYKDTVMHDDLSSHLAATVEGQDVSSMERVYRWVAAKRMVEVNPWLGTGPDTFYPEYFRYSVETFRTYVSDNPERSTTHNYLLMTATEQGIPGAVLLLTVVLVFFYRVYYTYHRCTDPAQRILAMAILLIMVVFTFHLTLNDLVEHNKVGPWYYLSLGLLIRLDAWQKKEN